MGLLTLHSRKTGGTNTSTGRSAAPRSIWAAPLGLTAVGGGATFASSLGTHAVKVFGLVVKGTGGSDGIAEGRQNHGCLLGTTTGRTQSRPSRLNRRTAFTLASQMPVTLRVLLAGAVRARARVPVI